MTLWHLELTSSRKPHLPSKLPPDWQEGVNTARSNTRHISKPKSYLQQLADGPGICTSCSPVQQEKA